MLEQGGAGCSPARPAVEQKALFFYDSMIFWGLVSICLDKLGLGDAVTLLGGDGCRNEWGTELLPSSVDAGCPEMVLQPLGIPCGRLSPAVCAAAHQCRVSSGLEEGRARERRAKLFCKLRLSTHPSGGRGAG